MRTLYIDASMGAAGDMITAALLELVPNEKSTLNRLNRIGVPNVEYRAGKVNKAGIMGTHVDVVINGVTENSETPGNHEAQGLTHHTLEDINKIIDTLNLPKKPRKIQRRYTDLLPMPRVKFMECLWQRCIFTKLVNMMQLRILQRSASW